MAPMMPCIDSSDPAGLDQEAQLLEGSDVEQQADGGPWQQFQLRTKPEAARDIFGPLEPRSSAWPLASVVLLLAVAGCVAVLGAAIAVRKHPPLANRLLTEMDEVYDFVGEGNCLPDRPQWSEGPGSESYEHCRRTCSAAPFCIGFDWDSKTRFCRARFATNAAAVLMQATIAPNFTFIRGVEGGRLLGKGLIKGIEGEGSSTTGCYQKARTMPYHHTFQVAEIDASGEALVGPFPNIFRYYRQNNLTDAALQARSSGLHIHNGSLLAFEGTDGGLILPSLDTTPLRRAMEARLAVQALLDQAAQGHNMALVLQEQAAQGHIMAFKPVDLVSTGISQVTLTVGVNSDSYNRGLGVYIEASPGLDEKKEHEGTSYSYMADSTSPRRNYIKFHPDYPSGGLRIEGPGGFNDTALPWTPPGWTASGQGLNVLTITMHVSGSNEVTLATPDGKKTWTGKWHHRLFDGKDVPALYAFMDLGGERGKPLYVGPVTLRCAP